MKYANDIDEMVKNHSERLAVLIEQANGVFDNIPWGTMRGQMLTLGTMADDHVANSLHNHKHLAEVARVAPEARINYQECKFCQFLMETVIESIGANGRFPLMISVWYNGEWSMAYDLVTTYSNLAKGK